MSPLMIAGLGAYCSFFAGIGWVGVCNHRTFKQRGKIIRENQRLIALLAFDLINARWLEFDGVKYTSHMWRLITFRNPWTLYGPLIRQQMGPK